MEVPRMLMEDPMARFHRADRNGVSIMRVNLYTFVGDRVPTMLKKTPAMAIWAVHP